MELPGNPAPGGASSSASATTSVSAGSPGAAKPAGGSAGPAVPFRAVLGRGARLGNAGGRGVPITAGTAKPSPRSLLPADGEPAWGGPLRHTPGHGNHDAEATQESKGDARGPAEDDGAGTDRTHRTSLDDLELDPVARHAAHLAPPAALGTQPSDAATSAAANEPVRARSLEELLPALVRRIAWAGDRQKGTVRLELGAGAYAGTTVTVHADAGRVRVEIGGHEGPELDRLRTRLDARLRGHGLDVESVS